MKISYNVKENIWTVEENYIDPISGMTILAGRKTNLASIPRIFWPIIAPFELSVEACVVHDYLYGRAAGYAKRENDVSVKLFRVEADLLFLKIMKSQSVPTWKRLIAYLCVRAFGWVKWNYYYKRNTK